LRVDRGAALPQSMTEKAEQFVYMFEVMSFRGFFEEPEE
jgi:hypothetical protein